MNSVLPNAGTSVVEDLSIVVVCDNDVHQKGLEAAWGFSCLVKGAEKTILFDTGGDGSILTANMDKLGIDAGDIDLVVLSHAHWDHVGGLRDFLQRNGKVTVFMLESFPVNLERQAEEFGAEVVSISKPAQICEGVYSTGEMGVGVQITEQALVVRTAEGAVVIAGCAHPGIVSMAERAKDITESELLLVMGGFHLLEEARDELDRIVARFRELNVRYAAPCHCSGDNAREVFRGEYGESYIDIGVGKVVGFGGV